MNILHKAFIITIAILAPIKATMFAVGFLIIVDFIFGMLAAHKRGEKITSAAMRRTVSKALVYQICILCGYLLDHYLTGDALSIAKIISGIIGSVELKSILENASTITGVDLVSSLLKKLGSSNDIPPSDSTPKQ